jgi:hypothetical protein
MTEVTHRHASTLAFAGLLAAAIPRLAGAQGLLARELSIPERARPELRVAVADPKSPSLDFDLLGEAPKPAAAAEDPSLRRRRSMLNLHQGLGIGLLGLQLASTVTGQLNYNDKFGVENTGRYKLTHKVVTYANLATFAVVGGIALLAPRDKNAPPSGLGRTTIHKVGMGLATLGMVTQGVLGVYTTQREGYLDQQRYGRAHLVVGYSTLAVMLVAVGALVL